MSGKPTDPLVRKAIETLAETARRRVAKHPQGHLLKGRRNRLEIQLPVPLGPLDGALDDAVREAEEVLTAELEALFLERTTFRPGHLLCLRCGSSECEHSAPRDAREIFAGYGASGIPRFVDFAQWLLERQHEDLDRIYETPPGLVTEVVSGRELSSELLPAFRDRQTDYRIHGQVVAGWFRVVRTEETRQVSTHVLALSLQVLSTRDRRRTRRKKSPPRRRLMLNVLGRGPNGETLEELYSRLGNMPWQPSVVWGQQVLQTIESSQGKKSSTPEVLSRRVEGLLQSIARRLEQGRRARERRTEHAEKRHREGDRPTRMAFADLARGDSDRFLLDERRETIVVLGDRGRAHVFNFEGKLVTSIRYSPESIDRKIRQEIWRRATAEEVTGLRKKAGVGASNG